MKWTSVLLIFSSTSCFLTMGCVGSVPEVPSSNSSVMHLGFARDGKFLRLASGSSANPKAPYPNPTQLDRIDCTVHGNGAIKQKCERSGESVDCIDPPIFATIKDGKVVVVDLHGTPLGEIPFEGKSGTPSGGVNATPPTSTNDDDDNVSPPSQTVPCESSELSTCPDAGTDADKPTEGGSCPSLTTAKAYYCAEVNAKLRKAGSSYVLDCSRLKDSTTDLACEEEREMTVDSPISSVGWTDCTSLTPIYAIWARADPENFEDDDSGLGSQFSRQCLKDGLVADFTNWDSQARQALRCAGQCLSSPLVLDLDGNGIQTTSLDEGVIFPMVGRTPVKTAWIKGNDAWLVLDRNQNSEVDGASELFGEVTAGRSHTNGFAALAELDDNRDGKIDGKDPMFSRLRLWTDRNRDAKSSPSELAPLTKSGIVMLDLAAQKIPAAQAADANGNAVLLKSTFVRTDGSRGQLADLYVRTRPLEVMSSR